jgi:hypothetical protein
MNRKITSIAAVVVVAMAGAAFAQSTPDFSGTWKLNTAKGKNLPMGGAVQETVTITQKAPKLTLDISSTFQGNTSKRQVNYDLAGKPVQNEGPMGDKSETVAKWDGNKLVVTWTSEGAVAGTKVTRTETRSVSADGKTMMVTSQRGTSPASEMVYEKQ